VNGSARDALVLDAHLRNAVAGLRGLGRAGVPAVAAGPSRAAAGLWSRYAAAREVGGAGEVAARGRPAVAYPSQESTIDALLRLGPDRAIVLPWDASAVRTVRSKRDLPRLAEAHGLRAPATLFDGTAAELRAADIPLPAVVKPAGAVGALPTARLVGSPAELEALAAGLPPEEPVLAQEHVGGALLSLALALDRDGQVAARFQEEVVRTWPPDAGSFAATVSAEPDGDLVERAAAVLRGAGYWGLAQLDLARGGGATILLDVNPRFYACMPLALACGVNLPAAWHAIVDGRTPPPTAPYPAGRAYRWLEGDLYAARHGDVSRLRRPGRPADAHAMWAGDDPLASVLLALDAATLPIRRRLRPARRGR